VPLEGLGKLKEWIHLIGCWTRDLPDCRGVPQPLRCRNRTRRVYLWGAVILNLAYSSILFLRRPHKVRILNALYLSYATSYFPTVAVFATVVLCTVVRAQRLCLWYISKPKVHMTFSNPSLVTAIKPRAKKPCLHSCQRVRILDSSRYILQKMLHAVSCRSLTSFQGHEVHVAVVTPAPRVLVSVMLLFPAVVTCRIRVRGGSETRNNRSEFREKRPTGSKAFWSLCSPCRTLNCRCQFPLSAVLRVLLRRKEAHFCDFETPLYEL
jgi:hypothetical protein